MSVLERTVYDLWLAKNSFILCIKVIAPKVNLPMCCWPSGSHWKRIVEILEAL